MKSARTMICLTLICLLVSASAWAGQSSARSVAMGGAYIGLAKGVDAARFNPANLGLNDYRSTSIEVVGAGGSITNNSFSLSDYNKYSGALLTDSDKQYILSRIPSEGLKFTADVEASVLSISYGQMAFSVTGVGLANANMSKDIVDLVFNGNSFADTTNFTGSYSDAVSYVSTGISYGMPVYKLGTRQIAVGATVSYIRGLVHEEVVELRGIASTGYSGFFADGNMTVRTATGGSGYAVDLGSSIQLNSNYSAGISIKNFLSNVNWNNNAEELRYLFQFDTTNLDNMSNNHVTSEDTTISLDSYSSKLPSVMTVGFAKRSGRTRWAIDWQQGFKRAAGASSHPRIAAGIEYDLLSAIPVRAGYAVGGEQNASFSFGSGFRLSMFHLDWAVVTGSSFSGYSSKGVNMAISTGLYF